MPRAQRTARIDERMSIPRRAMAARAIDVTCQRQVIAVHSRRHRPTKAT
jgi:hypothetical protein